MAAPIIRRGYRGSSTVKRAGTRIQYTAEQIVEMKKCRDDPIYFGEKYMKMVNLDEGFKTFPLYSYQKQIVSACKSERYVIAECARQSGKALPLDTPIPTPFGWTTMGKLQPGDKLFDENGHVTEVRSISKTFYNHDCFRITFDDGTTVMADAEHLWVVDRANASKRSIKTKKLTTRQLFDAGVVKTDSRGKNISKWKIKTAGPARYPNRAVDIDPYTFGLWLGDGSAADGRLTASFADQDFYESHLPYKLSHNHSKRDVYTGTIYGLSAELRNYDLINNKHIPIDYLINSVDVRLAVLQGLMDSDGTVEKSGRLCLALSYSRYPRLIEDAYELLVSLGLKVTRKEYPKTNSCRLYFQCSREKMEVFRLPRKLELQPPVQERPEHTDYRFIRNIERVESVPTKCIEVWNDSHLFLCSKHFIPTHNTTAMTVYIVWYLIFGGKHKRIAILANKFPTAQEILGRIKLAYEALPEWMAPGVEKWNESTMIIENGNRVIAAATSASNIRGFTNNIVYIDEAAHIENWDKFSMSVLPTISSGKTSQIILISTVNGLNHFYQYTSLAREGKSKYKLISVTWRDVPGRDEKWRQEALADLKFDEDKFAQEYENRYLGSGNTLIAGWKLTLLGSGSIPYHKQDNINMYEKPQPGHQYVITADVSRGKLLDYSTIQCIDVSQVPYKQVLTYRSNKVTPSDFAEVINRVGRSYNDAPVLIEINDLGEQTAETLHYDYEYPSVIFTESAGPRSKRPTHSYTPNKTDRGLRTTTLTKSSGCSLLKLLIEEDKLVINDFDTIFELSVFSKKGDSKKAGYEAADGHHDDLVMPLVIFAWLSATDYFTQLTNIKTVSALREATEQNMLDQMVPFGFTTDTIDEDYEVVEGDLWFKVGEIDF